MEQGTGNGDALCLSFGEATTLLATEGVEAIGQVIDKEGAGTRQGIAHLVIGGIELAELEIVANGAAQEAVALWHVGDGIGIGFQRKRITSLIDKTHCTLGRTQQAEENTHQGALATACRTDDGCARGGSEGASEVMKYVTFAIGITIGDVLELQPHNGSFRRMSLLLLI